MKLICSSLSALFLFKVWVGVAHGSHEPRHQSQRQSCCCGGPLQHWSARSIPRPGERLMIIDSFMILFCCYSLYFFFSLQFFKTILENYILKLVHGYNKLNIESSKSNTYRLKVWFVLLKMLSLISYTS